MSEVEIIYDGHTLEQGRILSLDDNVVVFKIEKAGCRATILERSKITSPKHLRQQSQIADTSAKTNE